MTDGFIKVASATCDIKVADTKHNADAIIEKIQEAADRGVKIICFPELCITGYTCGDLFLQDTLLKGAKEAVEYIAYETKHLDIVAIVGLPCVIKQKLYNIAVVLNCGKVIGGTAKQNLPNYSEFYEMRHFTPAEADFKEAVSFGKEKSCFICCSQIYSLESMPNLKFGIEICEDLWVADTPSVRLAENGATIIFNLSASDEVIGKRDYRKNLIKAKSGSLCCGYVYADAGIGESTQDMVFAGHNIIVENGTVLAESELFENDMIIADIDVDKLAHERRRMNTFKSGTCVEEVNFVLTKKNTVLEHGPAKLPFVPIEQSNLNNRCKEILTMQSIGLATRIKHIGCKNVVIGLSGGLDSTLALIVAVHAFDRLGLDRSGIRAITMPCFGTTDRTYNNACKLALEYHTSLEEINIKDSVLQHFKDIGQSENIHDVTYENSQARERTQILMDKANMYGGIVVGTGDLSELALGWATYNGDHMSMYAVNASIPKTLVRWLVDYESRNATENLRMILNDILDTPVSPELLPPDEKGNIAQRTEDLVGPYELHDFFLYYMLRFGFTPRKIYRLATISFAEDYSREFILKWMKTFYRRFFSQQFKRSCMPDAPKVGTVTLSPRGDFRMPSDASYSIWMKELEEIQ
ncbi:NAD+ synthase (glutamine-hydrolysing) [Pseudobutyrivibrio ruminis]|uniref:Glutamine-dependent NAD(+) synthetase n=1 Tax=Pseudobutyrivibrio ruminis TaxID=46206 RepID=A0A1H7IRC0_9FIRM|nr:NAD(+) synthase [Pseudobutyrivibrio ruminis]SEK64976.1 NAD+ synthase (glutamine-hydrolysing) [Pseudobutyrivibrio ruminis]